MSWTGSCRTGRPFFAIDGHSLWINSKALEMAGINRDTPDPVPGLSYYVRDAHGEATG